MTEAALCLLYAIIFIALIRLLPFFRISGLNKWALPLVFVLKILCGVAMYVVYTKVYTDRSTADIFKYFDDSKIMYDALFSAPGDFLRMITGFGNDSPHFDMYYNQMNYWYRVYESNIYNDSHTIIRFNALLRFFSFGYYNVHTVFMCFISLGGMVGIYRFFLKVMPEAKNMLFFAAFLIPSLLFWGSGVLKEGLLLFGMGMFLWHTELLLSKRKVLWSVCFVLLSFFLLLYTKFYILITILPLVIAYTWCRLGSPRYAFLKFIIVIAVALAAGLNFHYIFPSYDFVAILVQKQHDFLNLARSVNSGSLIGMQALDYSVWSLVTHAPQALYHALFRPWFFESDSFLMLFSGLENLMFVMMFMTTVFYFKKPVSGLPHLWLALFFSLGILVLTGLTTPVMGAIVRYKVPALPFLLMVMIMVIDRERLLRNLRDFRKKIFSKA